MVEVSYILISPLAVFLGLSLLRVEDLILLLADSSPLWFLVVNRLSSS